MKFIWIATAYLVLILALATVIEDFSVFLFCIALVTIFAVLEYLILMPKKKKTKSALRNKQTVVGGNLQPTIDQPAVLNSKEKPCTAPAIADGEKDHFILPQVCEDAAQAYNYTKSICLEDDAFRHIPGNGGAYLDLRPEPDNRYDPRAVAIYLHNSKIGYVYRGQVQDMIHDYLSKGWPVIAHLNRYSEANNTAEYKIGFYKPLRLYKYKVCNLTKTNKKKDDYTNRGDYIENCNVGDEISCHYDSTLGSYVVSTLPYLEIGELPKSCVTFLEDNEWKYLTGIIESIDTKDNGDFKVSVRVYLIQ